MRKTDSSHGSLASYAIGFVCSIALTLLAYFLVTRHAFATSGIVTVITTLAILQLFVQLIFFLHLNRGSDAGWNQTALLLAAFFVIVVVVGSLWIMRNLDYSTKTVQDLTNYILQQEAIPK